MKVMGTKVMGTYVLKSLRMYAREALDAYALDSLGPTPGSPGKVLARHRRERVWKACAETCGKGARQTSGGLL